MKKWLKVTEIICTAYILISVLLWVGYHWLGLAIPDHAIRATGMIDLIAIPLYVFLQFKKGNQE